MRVLHGDRRSRINTNEPIPDSVAVAAPDWLPPRALAVWDRLAPDLIRNGLLTSWDVDSFADYCALVVVNRDALADIDAKGMTCTTLARELADGTCVYRLVKNPAWQVARESTGLLVSLGGRFGLNPSDRAQIKVGGSSSDPNADLLSSP